MRNLKKVLSLALAMVMLLGMMVIGAGAVETKFTDDGKIGDVYKEAVAVMYEIGVLNGKDDKGNFDPQGTLTRAEAATIITRAVLGSSVAGALSSSTCVFTDVPDWAKGAVQYCADMGIVYGIGNNLFAPSNPVKGTEFATMLLRAVDPNGDYSGASWASKVVAAANKYGLSANIPVTSTALTREGAAQMAFNTIVDYSPSGETAWSVNGLTFDSFIEAYVANGNSATGITKTTANDSLAATVFGLSASNTEDAFGNPIKNWNYNGEVVTTVPLGGAVQTYTADTTERQITRDLSGYSVPTGATGDTTTPIGTAADLNKARSVIVSVDGADPVALGVDTTSRTPAAAIKDLTGNGVRVDVYATGKVIDKIVVVHELLGTVSRVTEANGDNDRTVTVGGRTFATNNFERGDKVIYTMAGTEIQTMALAEVVEGASVSSARDDRVNTNSGTYYFHDGHTVRANDWNFDSTYNLFLDSYGYIIGQELVEGEAAAPQYALVTRLASSGFDKIAMLVLPDGTTVRATLASDSPYASDVANGADPVLVSYTEDNGEYKLDDEESAGALANSTVIIDTGKASLKGIGGNKTANNSTLFFVKTGTNKYTVYQGIRNVPKLETSGSGNSAKGSAIVDSKNVALAVYVDASDSDHVSNSGSASSASIFVLGDDSSVIRDSVKGNHYTYIALVDGEIVEEFDVKDPVTEAKMYNTVSYDSHDVATLSGEVTSKTGIAAARSDVVEIGGDGYTYDDDTLVFYVDNNDLTPSSVNAIETDTNDTVWVAANSNGKATIIVIKANSNSSTTGNTTTITGNETVDAPTGSKEIVVSGSTGQATVEGNVTGTVTAQNNATVEIKGNVASSATVNAASGADVTVDGNVAGNVTVAGDASVTVKGNVTGTITANPGATVVVEGKSEKPVEIKAPTGTTPTPTDNLASIIGGSAGSAIKVESGIVDWSQLNGCDDSNGMLIFPYEYAKVTGKKVLLTITKGDDVVYQEITGKKTQTTGSASLYIPTAPIGGWTDDTTPSAAWGIGYTHTSNLTSGTYSYTMYAVAEGTTLTNADGAKSTIAIPTGSDLVMEGSFTIA